MDIIQASLAQDLISVYDIMISSFAGARVCVTLLWQHRRVWQMECSGSGVRLRASGQWVGGGIGLL